MGFPLKLSAADDLATPRWLVGTTATGARFSRGDVIGRRLSIAVAFALVVADRLTAANSFLDSLPKRATSLLGVSRQRAQRCQQNASRRRAVIAAVSRRHRCCALLRGRNSPK
jgi:hypothetical protein